jgi:hypothetical protein
VLALQQANGSSLARSKRISQVMVAGIERAAMEDENWDFRHRAQAAESSQDATST